MTPPAAPCGAAPGAPTPARRRARSASPAKAGPKGGNAAIPPTAERPGTVKRGAARTPAAHTAGVAARTPPPEDDDDETPPEDDDDDDDETPPPDDDEALKAALALINKVDAKVANSLPCPCGRHEAVHQCAARAAGRNRWVLSVPPYVIWTEASREGARRPRVAINAFETEDEAWDFQALIREAHLRDMRSSAAVAPLRARAASPSHARRRMQLGAAAPQAAAPAPARAAREWEEWEEWDDIDAGAGAWSYDADEAGPSCAAPRRGTKQPVVVVAPQDEQTRLAEQYIGSRVCFDGGVGTVKGFDEDMEDTYRFNVRYDDDTFGDIALRDIKDAVAAAAAAGHHPAAVPAVPVQVHTPANDHDVIVISDDEDDDVPPPPTQAEATPAPAAPPPLPTQAEATPAPAAPPPRRNARKSSQPTKRGRALPDAAAAPPVEVDEPDDAAAPPDEADEPAAAAAAPAKRARRALHDAAAPDSADAAAAAAEAATQPAATQPAAPVLELSALPQAELVRLSSAITIKLTCGEGPVGKLGEGDVQRLLDKLVALDLRLLSAFVRFEKHGDERQLCGDWRALLRESA